VTPENVADIKENERAEVPPEITPSGKVTASAVPAKPEVGRASQKERIRA
jgi:hypothetical protein